VEDAFVRLESVTLRDVGFVAATPTRTSDAGQSTVAGAVPGEQPLGTLATWVISMPPGTTVAFLIVVASDVAPIVTVVVAGAEPVNETVTAAVAEAAKTRERITATIAPAALRMAPV
jgi:hypothetical protein